MTMLAIPDLPVNEWLAELKSYQRTTLEAFLTSDDAERAAEKWLTTLGSPNIAAFGGQPADTKPFWGKIPS
jgi:hypothetical protein